MSHWNQTNFFFQFFDYSKNQSSYVKEIHTSSLYENQWHVLWQHYKQHTWIIVDAEMKKSSSTMVNWIGENVSNNVDWIPNDLWFVFDQSTSRFQSFLFPEKEKEMSRTKLIIIFFFLVVYFLFDKLVDKARQWSGLAIWKQRYNLQNWQPNYVIWGRYR